jgi:hypothetical protein
MSETLDGSVFARAPQRHKIRTIMLSLMPKRARVAEIGVSSGLFSQVILDLTEPCQLLLIDPWDLLGGTATDDNDKWFNQSSFMEGEYIKVVDMFSEHPEVIVARNYSVPVLSTFPDNYFDWMYIDGSHLYDQVTEDLEIALQKIRLGGMIAGDDFFWKRNNRKHVRDAVFDFLTMRGIERKLDVVKCDNLPSAWSELIRPTRIGQQYLLPVTEELKRGLS